MRKEDLRIVYMGTPDFVVESLKVLYENGYNIVGVVTMPDKPAGRGHKIQFSPVKQFALDHNLRLLQPERLKDEAFVDELRSLNADLQIVVAFRMLPEIVWNMPRLGTFNLHASLLPQYRGAAPINWAVINGDKETGVTTFFLKHEIDTGNIILQEKIDILAEDNAGTIHDKLMILGGQLTKKTVDCILEENVKEIPQKEDIELRSAPKIFKDTCRLSFENEVENVHNFVRGMSPYPTAWIELLHKESKDLTTMKIFETSFEKKQSQFLAGTILTDNKTFAKIVCSDGELSLLSVQLAGKKRMSIKDLLCGFALSDFEIK